MCAAGDQLDRCEVSRAESEPRPPAPEPSLGTAPGADAGSAPEARAGAGQRAEFERFFADVAPQLMRAAYLLTGSRSDAEDLVQDVLSRAWQHWGRVSHHERPEAWARRVLSNLVINRWKHREVEHRHRAAHLPPSRPAPGEVEHLDVLSALAELPVRPRTAIVLHDVVGLSVDEIARQLRVPQGTVRSWMHRGRRRLALRLGAEDEGA